MAFFRVYSSDIRSRLLPLLVEIVPCLLLWFPTLSIVLSPDPSQGPGPAVLHLHETLVRVGLVVGAADWLVIARTDAAATGEYKVEVLQALGDGSNEHVAARN